MICYIQKYSNLDINDYQEFLEDVFNASFNVLDCDINSFYKLETNVLKKYVLIKGENLKVLQLINRIAVNQQNLIVISCTIPLLFKILHDKRIKKYELLESKKVLIPKYSEHDEFLTKYDGRCYGFNFDLSRAELNMYRSRKKNIYDNLSANFNIKQIRDLQVGVSRSDVNG